MTDLSFPQEAALKVQASQAQQQAADPGHCVFVNASAGTGKTTVLTDRIFRLLLEGAPPSRLLALTFTNAGANVMKNRVIRRLGDWAGMSEKELYQALTNLLPSPPSKAQLERAPKLLVEVLDCPDGLNVMTIHSFCEQVLRRFPLEAGVSANFTVIDETASGRLMHQTEERLFATHQSHGDQGAKHPYLQALEALSRNFGRDNLRHTLFEILENQARFYGYLEPGGEEAMQNAWRSLFHIPEGQELHDIPEAYRKFLWERRDQIRQIFEVVSRFGTATEKKKLNEYIAPVLNCDTPEELHNVVINRFTFFWLTLKLEKRKSPITKKVKDNLPSEGGEWVEEQVDAAKNYHNALGNRKLFEIQQHFLTLTTYVLEEYRRSKQAEGVLDFDDLILKTVDLLKSENGQLAWVLYKLDSGLDHLLVDEAQDTNPDQWLVIERLAKGLFENLESGPDEEIWLSRAQSLFVVGDHKQSIMGFQRANPAIFEQKRQSLRQLVEGNMQKFKQVDMQISFRSAPQILQATNLLFSQTENQQGVMDSDGNWAEQISASSELPGRVELWPLSPALRNDEGKPLNKRHQVEIFLERLSDKIAYWVNSEEGADDAECYLASGKRIAPEDILLLVRSRPSGNAQAALKAIAARGVGVAGMDRYKLAEELAVRDLLNYARFLLLPDDDLALAALLKSPFFGLTEKELEEIAAPRKKGQRLWPRLLELAGQSTANSQKLGAYVERLQSMLLIAESLPPFELFYEILLRAPGQAASKARLGALVDDLFDAFLDSCREMEERGVPSLQALVESIENSSAEVKRELEEGVNLLRLMTVHGAKGREAPIVILIDATSEAQARISSLQWQESLEQGKGLFVVLPASEVAGSEERSAFVKSLREKDSEEQMRLLYVAMTRAKERLIVSGWTPSKKLEGFFDEEKGKSWYSRLWRAFSELTNNSEADIERIKPADGQTDIPSGFSLGSLPERESKPFSEESAAEKEASGSCPWIFTDPRPEPKPERPFSVTRPTRSDPPQTSPLALGSGDAGKPEALTALKRGLVIHALLQYLPPLAHSERRSRAHLYLARFHPELSSDQRKLLADQCLALFEAPELEGVFQEPALCEVPLVGSLEDKNLSGRVDRLLVRKDSVQVIDYKSQTTPPENITDIPPAHREQMEQYRTLLTAVFPDRPITCQLVYTQGPRVFTLPKD